MSYKGFFALQTLKYLCSPPSHPAAHLQLRQSGILLLEAHCHGRHPLHVAVGQHLPRVWVGQAFRTMGLGWAAGLSCSRRRPIVTGWKNWRPYLRCMLIDRQLRIGACNYTYPPGSFSSKTT